MNLSALGFKVPFLFFLVSSFSNADSISVTGTIESVKTYDECTLVRMKGDSLAYVFPATGVTASSKLSLALSALHSSKSVDIDYLATQECASMDDQPSSAPLGTKVYIYSISISN